MDIRQLRAGNLVTTNGKPAGTTKGNIYKVLDTNNSNMLDDLIGSATIATKEIEYRSLTDIWAKDLEPIAITEELLEKIGFKCCMSVLFLQLKYYGINFTYNKFDGFTLWIDNYKEEPILHARIEYLHTLQNLILDITGLDLNVDNLISK